MPSLSWVILSEHLPDAQCEARASPGPWGSALNMLLGMQHGGVTLTGLVRRSGDPGQAVSSARVVCCLHQWLSQAGTLALFSFS